MFFCSSAPLFLVYGFLYEYTSKYSIPILDKKKGREEFKETWEMKFHEENNLIKFHFHIIC